jgi:hypothetical protein
MVNILPDSVIYTNVNRVFMIYLLEMVIGQWKVQKRSYAEKSKKDVIQERS